MFAKKAFRPSGKKGDLINGLAAIQVKQTALLNYAGRFPLRNDILINTPSSTSVAPQQVIAVPSGGTVELLQVTAAPPKDTSVPHQDSAVLQQYATSSQKNTEVLTEPLDITSFSVSSTTLSQQIVVVNLSSIPSTSSSTMLAQKPFKANFFKNIPPPFFRAQLPPPNSYLHSTRQLAFVGHLLQTTKKTLPSLCADSRNTCEGDIQEMELEETNRSWMDHNLTDQAEQARFHRLISQVASQFLRSYRNGEMSINEVILLASVLDRSDYRKVLSALIGQFDSDRVLIPELVRGLVYFLQSASPGDLTNDDLVRVLRIFRDRLRDTYKKPGDTNSASSEHIYLLVIAVSRVLDTMVESKINDLSFEVDFNSLLDILEMLKESSDQYLKHQVAYAWQALQYVGDDESPLEKTVRISSELATATMGVANVFKLESICCSISQCVEVFGRAECNLFALDHLL
jgi:hypothetical protein